jgi:predicted MFS family arabinose efflux permease
MFCCAGALLLTIFEPVTWVLTAELAGESRATANGLLATSNQLGFIGGASVGGLVHPVGGYPLVGFFFSWRLSGPSLAEHGFVSSILNVDDPGTAG